MDDFSHSHSEAEYNPDFVELLEIAYGEGFLSTGGSESVDAMFEGIDLEGKKILDIGCGVGGVDFYLASKHDTEILGIDIEPYVIEQAKAKLANQELKGKVFFQTYSDLSKFPNNSYDIIFSKETLLHVQDKQALFDKAYKLLKPGGQLIILDWLHSTPEYSELLSKFIEFDGLVMHLVTPDEYSSLLEKAGFKKVKYIDETVRAADETMDIIKKLESKEFIEKVDQRFGQDYVKDYCLPSWQMQYAVQINKEILVGKLLATK